MVEDKNLFFEKARQNSLEIVKVMSNDPEVAGAALMLCYLGIAETGVKDAVAFLMAGADTLIDRSLDIEKGRSCLNPSKN